jgi:hypothetical protein
LMIVDQIWGWLGVISAMFGCFRIGGQKGCMEDVVDLPLGWQI